MIVFEETNKTAEPAEDSVAKLDIRFSIVRDAVVNDKPHLDEATAQFLRALYDALAQFRIDSHDMEPLDERVIRALTEMKVARDQFLEFASLVSANQRSAEIHPAIRLFLGQALAYKHAPRDVTHFNHLWCDHYRFLLRELFVGVIALLIASKDYEEVNRYLEADYLFETDRGPQTAKFPGFDSYIKSLDEFRMRRLRRSRLSAAAELQKERSDLGFLSFANIMQADFVLCMRGLLHYPGALIRWFPRTLVYADDYRNNGFDLFVAARSKAKFAPVCTVLKVRDKTDLLNRFAKATKECYLAEWKLGGVPIPFENYLGLAALATA